jgi:hypothetical protein
MAALAGLAVRADKAGALTDDCQNYIPDGPYGLLSWRSGGVDHELKVNGSCLQGAQHDKEAVAFDANHIVARLAKAQPVTERR